MESGAVEGSDTKPDNIVTEFYIPTYIFDAEAKAETLPDELECPVLVFINSKSGGQLGGDLLLTYQSVLNECQVVASLYSFIVQNSMF